MGFKSFLSVGVVASFMITGHAAWAPQMEDALAKIAECDEKRCNQLRLGGIKGFDLPPEAPSFTMRVCGFGFHNLFLRFGQARRARIRHVAQAPVVLLLVFGFPARSVV